MTKNSKWRILYPLFFIIVLSVLGYQVYRLTDSAERIRIVAFKSGDGWGYKLKIRDRIIIKQAFIPIIQGKKPFPDRHSAIKAGRIMRERLYKNVSPSLKPDDFPVIGIDSLGNSN
jgi:hypothetical protein